MLTKRMIEEIQEMSYSLRLPIINEIIKDENIRISNRLNSLEIELFNEKLYALVLNKKYIETIELANQLIRCLNDYNLSKVYRYKAEALHKLERYDECLNAYEKDFKTNTDCSWYSNYFQAGDAARQKGLYSKAFNYYKEGFFKFLDDNNNSYRRNFSIDNSTIEFLHNEFNVAWGGFMDVISREFAALEDEDKLMLLRAKVKSFVTRFQEEAEHLVCYGFFDKRNVLGRSNELNRIIFSEPEFIRIKKEEEAKKAEEERLNNYLAYLDEEIKSLDEQIETLKANDSVGDKETDSDDLWAIADKALGFGNK